ncbi:MAG: HAD family hydrolase [Oscillospiraceae bacterium]
MFSTQKTTILFDLDGTLLPFWQDAFVQRYIHLLVKKLAPLGYDPDLLVRAVWDCTGAMVKNDGAVTNLELFWTRFSQLTGWGEERLNPLFLDFYQHEFDGVRTVLTEQRNLGDFIHGLRQGGYGLVLATNPLFPPEAVETRLRWVGLTSADFDHITTMDNSCHCKPNPAYYRDICDRLHLAPEACVMVGNNATEDMAAGEIGMDTFLITDHLENPFAVETAAFPQGGLAEFAVWLG